jgi:uncharacterized membrane protein (TIGR02234 family)
VTPAAREYACCLGLGAAGAALVLVAARQGWAQVVSPAPAPLPASPVTVRGQDLVPVAGALALVALAGLAAVIATRGLARRLTGLLVAASGAAATWAVSVHLSAASVLAAARAAAVAQAGSATAGGGPGVSAGAVAGGGTGLSTAAHVAMAAFPWRGLALLGALAVLAAGMLAAWRGPRWPAMSSRYDAPGGPASPARPGAGREQPVADTATLWESLSRGVDPTEQPGRPGGR